MKKIVVLLFSSLVFRLSSVVYLSSFFCLLSVLPARANNMDVSNISLVDQSASGGTIDVQFDISWNNSWRATTNYDAAWVFIKYSTDSGTTWAHATLKTSGTNPSGFSRGSGTTLDIVVPTDKKGAFLQRTSSGSGSVSATDIELVWDWSADGLSASATARVKVFAIEMVYIPTGSFYIGSGGTEVDAFYKYPTTTNTYLISSEAAINVGTTADYLYYPVVYYGGDQSGPIPAAFPKGYSAFYLMKHEISQGQYADFLCMITSTHAAARYPNYNGNFRHTISGTYPNYSASRPDRSCNYLSWGDISAYADWAGLRPMTELEFVKACRGAISPLANGFAWGGNADIYPAATISGAEDGTETITGVANANCRYNNTTLTGGDAGGGPLRCGIFATTSSTRLASGAGYYGNMELSGNVSEAVISAGNTYGRAFTGSHGDGLLNGTGDADVVNWPGTDSQGTGNIGGPWGFSVLDVRVSERRYVGMALTSRFASTGGRCARTAP